MRAWTIVLLTLGASGAVLFGCGGSAPVEVDAFVPEDAGPVDAATLPDAAECGTASDCDDGLFCNGVEACTGGRCVSGMVACSDGIDCTADVCNETMRSCDFTVPDDDADGYGDADCLDAAGVALGNDCADDDADTFPGNRETCDTLGHDEDCDPLTHGGTDADSDGYESSECCNPDPLDPVMGRPLCGPDCDDARPATNPVGTETCDGLDQDCDTRFDEGTLLEGFEDLDFDGYGSTVPAQRCAAAVGFSRIPGDCDDANPAANPGLPELCDAAEPIDNNCDGSTTDTPGTTTWYDDDDGDGFGSAASGTTISCMLVPGASLRNNDCNDMRADVNPAQAERCDGIDDNCNGLADFLIGSNNFEDDDSDGLVDIACAPTGTDCDDTNPATGPGETESCDGRDNDCDTRVDEGATSLVYYRDLDADGFGSVASGSIVACMTSIGFVARAGDCNDADASRYPGAAELCDSGDNDCDAAVDEAPAAAGCGMVDHGVPGCMAGRCTILSCDMGYSDCNHMTVDGCEAMGVGPGRPDTCDGIDNDCDSRTDEDAPTRVYYTDLDGDGFGSATSGSIVACSAPSGSVTSAGDCNDMDRLRFPGAIEACDAGDNDCDGATDEAPASTACATALPHAVGTCASGGVCAIVSCTGTFADCNHLAGDGCEVAGAGGGVMDTCDGLDNDCDGRFDENAATSVFYRDADSDTYGATSGGTVLACVAPFGYVARAGDCNDMDALRRPGAIDTCNNADDDCDAAVDEMPASATCGTAAQATVACTMGACGLSGCASGFADCDTIAGNGCEVTTPTDVANCGGCGMDCRVAPRVTGAACATSRCTITGCAPGYQDCDLLPGNGCETSTTSDPMHCGTCTTVCGPSQFCSAGVCATACGPGLILCDGRCVNPQSDVAYCGASGACTAGLRGAVCSPGEACASGSCSASFISPGVDAVSMTWPRAVSYVLDTPNAATIFYTLDGTQPGVSGSTMTGAAPVTLGALGSVTTLRWIAQFAGGGTETIVHQVQHSPLGGTNDLGQIAEALNLNGQGPVATVAPGAAVTGTVQVQYWRSNAAGYCPGCFVQHNLTMDALGVLRCVGVGSTFPGTSETASFSFTAPTTPGRYYFRANLGLQYGCPPGNPPSGGGFPIGVLYVR